MPCSYFYHDLSYSFVRDFLKKGKERKKAEVAKRKYERETNNKKMPLQERDRKGSAAPASSSEGLGMIKVEELVDICVPPLEGQPILGWKEAGAAACSSTLSPPPPISIPPNPMMELSESSSSSPSPPQPSASSSSPSKPPISSRKMSVHDDKDMLQRMYKRFGSASLDDSIGEASPLDVLVALPLASDIKQQEEKEAIQRRVYARFGSASLDDSSSSLECSTRGYFES